MGIRKGRNISYDTLDAGRSRQIQNRHLVKGSENGV